MWIQISAGRGPVECSRAVWHLVRALEKEMKKDGREMSILDCLEEAQGAFRSALLRLEGELPSDFPASGEGTVLWVSQSRDRPGHGRKNWFVDVAVLPEIPLASVDDTRLRIETMRSSGAGGQNVNKVETGVRITHLATGIVVVASEERSQLRNKSLAYARLRAKLDGLVTAQGQEREAQRWRRHDDIVRGAPFRTYEGEDFARR